MLTSDAAGTSRDRALPANPPNPAPAPRPAITAPEAGSITSPAALTAAMAPTTRPFGSVIDAEPMPPFIERAGPAILPIVAPAPAPTLPSATGPSVAASAALYPQSAV